MKKMKNLSRKYQTFASNNILVISSWILFYFYFENL